MRFLSKLFLQYLFNAYDGKNVIAAKGLLYK